MYYSIGFYIYQVKMILMDKNVDAIERAAEMIIYIELLIIYEIAPPQDTPKLKILMNILNSFIINFEG